jgi:hypothetical protein
MTGATALNPGLVAAQYRVTGSFAPGAAFTLAVYRSASRSQDPSRDTPLGTVTLTNRDLSSGDDDERLLDVNVLGDRTDREIDRPLVIGEVLLARGDELSRI